MQKRKDNRHQIGCSVSNEIISEKNNHDHRYAHIINEIGAEYAREKIPLSQHEPCSALSICKARMKLLDDAIKTINRNIISVLEDENYPKTGKGHRLFAIDGSKLNIPRGLLEDRYKIPKTQHDIIPMQ
ncbi:hypothetical protein EWM60_19035 [Candidatus Erwinia dacicola]|nr:hypothetical protein [Candidatus Erwinia dacicola]